mmetsp:Transcript_14199/g.17156  ORF Transcript_14199/g.17156 Transcript_14199/m.17156 type:complete len:364 (+) Transcript_14199:1-1092(+)
MEADLSLIASGAKQKDAFMKETLITLRRVFDVVYDDAAKLDQAMREHFLGGSTAHHSAPSGNSQPFGQVDSSGFISRCGHCANSMNLHVKTTNDNKKRYALRCQSCNENYILPEFAETFVRLDLDCHLCGFEAIQVTSTKPDGTQITKNVCPKCLRQPPKGSNHRGGDFTCAHCLCQEHCRLAKGLSSTPICPCYSCQHSSMRLFRLSNDSICVKCDTCTAAIYLPKETVTVSVLEEACPHCDQTKGNVFCIRVKFPKSKCPNGSNANPKVCILCDTYLKDQLNFILRRGTYPPSSRTGGGRGTSHSRGTAGHSSTGLGRGRGRQTTSSASSSSMSSSSVAIGSGQSKLPPPPPRPPTVGNFR